MTTSDEETGFSSGGAAIAVRVVAGPLASPEIEGRRSTAIDAYAEVVTADRLLAIMTACPRLRAERSARPLGRAMAEFHIETRLRRAAFLAQIAFESAELSRFEELGSGMDRDVRVAPAKARELGNAEPGDGLRYKGRGALRLVGRASYRDAGRALGLDLEGCPELAAREALAYRISGYLWERRGLNALADEGKLRDITRLVAGAESHHDARMAYYERALAALEG